jgi:GGDEF domain-containing protein
VSIGIATFPQDTQTKEELITLADKAMYIAKFSGKNQTCSA